MSESNSVETIISKWVRRAFIVTLIAGLASVLCAFLDSRQFLQSYLFGFLMWWNVAVGCLGLLMLYNLVGGRWGTAARPFLESGSQTIPLTAILFLPIGFNLDKLYPWMEPSVVSEQKAAYLNAEFFLWRALGYFSCWSILTFLVRRKASDKSDAPRWLRRVSAGGLVLLVLTVTFAGIDWGMSLEPHWFSSIYGAIIVIGAGLSGMALAVWTMATLDQAYSGSQTIFPDQTRADVATLMFAFLMLWAYFCFSQFLIIWSGNIPEENVWYVHRMEGGWQWLGLSIFIFQFAVPFIVLLSRDFKRSAKAMSCLAAVILVMHMAELAWMILPAFHSTLLEFHWADAVVPVALGGLWLSSYLRLVKQRVPSFVTGDGHD